MYKIYCYVCTNNELNLYFMVEFSILSISDFLNHSDHKHNFLTSSLIRIHVIIDFTDIFLLQFKFRSKILISSSVINSNLINHSPFYNILRSKLELRS